MLRGLFRCAEGSAMAEPLTVDALLAWGRDYQRQLEEAQSGPFHVPKEVLKQYLAKANEGLELLKHGHARGAGGRPKGTGMGDAVAALIAAGAREEDAVRAIATAERKSPAVVRAALRRYRKQL
jgi:hypothetical protein